MINKGDSVVIIGEERDIYKEKGDSAKICNICEKEFDRWDTQENFGFHYKVGYGSKFDLNKIDLNMCCDCFDKIFDCILSQCKINPLTEYELEGGTSDKIFDYILSQRKINPLTEHDLKGGMFDKGNKLKAEEPAN